MDGHAAYLAHLRDIERRLTQDSADMWASIMRKHEEYAQLQQSLGAARQRIREHEEAS